MTQNAIPNSDNVTRVVLTNGEQLKLDGQTDVGGDNLGMLIYETEGAKPPYVAWDDVARVEFEK